MIETTDGYLKQQFSILDPGTKENDPTEVASYYLDLNLDQLIDKVSAKWGKNVRRYYRYLPATASAVSYRRAVYADIKKEAVYRALLKYTEDLEEVDKLRAEKEKVLIRMQQTVWQIREASAYFRALETLKCSLEEASLSSEGMLGFLHILKELFESEEFLKLTSRTSDLLSRIRELRFILSYDKERMSVELGELEGEGAYEEMLKSFGGKEIRHLKNPFHADPSLTELENACLEILIKKKPEFFTELQTIAGIYEEIEFPVLKRFEREVIFYLSFRTLQQEMEKAGFVFSAPESGERMEARGLYDLALALRSLSSGKAVIANDLYYEKGERFFVLTGPNQGGKTTFARSLGQLVYFSRIGLDVPAASACVPFFPDIQTHFSVEESVETGRGKLKEELVRLAPMMEDERRGNFVIINELFTTAASYDAEIMGKKVLKHFIALECMGIYVTHLKELSSGQEGVVSLRATLDENRMQTFKILRGAADDTACAENLVKRYQLTYEQLKERL